MQVSKNRAIGWGFALLFGLAMPAAAGPVTSKAVQAPQPGVQAPWPVSSALSDHIDVKIVATKRRRHGNLMDANLRVEFLNVPRGRGYKMCLWDMGMKSEGKRPGCLDHSFKPGSEGKIYFDFEVTDFIKGEWIQISIRSLDGQVRKTTRFIPYQ